MKPIYTAEVKTAGDRKGGKSQSTDGKFSVELSMPTELGGAGGTGTNPEQLFAAGYSACFASAIGAVGGKAGKNTHGVEVTAHVSIGKKDDGEGFALAVKLQVHLPNVSKEEAEQLVADAHKICPYSNATRNNIPVELSIV